MWVALHLAASRIGGYTRAGIILHWIFDWFCIEIDFVSCSFLFLRHFSLDLAPSSTTAFLQKIAFWGMDFFRLDVLWSADHPWWLCWKTVPSATDLSKYSLQQDDQYTLYGYFSKLGAIKSRVGGRHIPSISFEVFGCIIWKMILWLIVTQSFFQSEVWRSCFETRFSLTRVFDPVPSLLVGGVHIHLSHRKRQIPWLTFVMCIKCKPPKHVTFIHIIGVELLWAMWPWSFCQGLFLAPQHDMKQPPTRCHRAAPALHLATTRTTNHEPWHFQSWLGMSQALTYNVFYKRPYAELGISTQVKNNPNFCREAWILSDHIPFAHQISKNMN